MISKITWTTKMACVYKIQSRAKSERVYIGSTSHVKKRWRDHIRELRGGRHGNKRLQRHFNKYGEDDLVFEIIEQYDSISRECLLAIEQRYLDSLNPYFNLCKIAGSNAGVKRSKEWCERLSKSLCGRKGAWTGKHHSEETKKKLSEILTGREISDEWRKNLSEGHKGYKASEETRRKMSLASKGNKSRLGHKASEETKRKMSKSHKGKKNSAAHNRAIKDGWKKRKAKAA